VICLFLHQVSILLELRCSNCINMRLGPTHKATSLYQHKWEDEMRRRLKVQKCVRTNWQILNNPKAKVAALVQEKVQQKQWQIRFNAKGSRLVSDRICDLKLPLLEIPVKGCAIG
jgi:hypothetical protein